MGPFGCCFSQSTFLPSVLKKEKQINICTESERTGKEIQPINRESAHDHQFSQVFWQITNWVGEQLRPNAFPVSRYIHLRHYLDYQEIMGFWFYCLFGEEGPHLSYLQIHYMMCRTYLRKSKPKILQSSHSFCPQAAR